MKNDKLIDYCREENNAFELRLLSIGCRYKDEKLTRLARLASDRFCRMAKLLPGGVGLQVQTDATRKFTAHFYSAEDSGMTSDDVNWLLKDCGSAKEQQPAKISGIADGGRRLYVFVYDAPEYCLKDDCDTTDLSSYGFKELYTMLCHAGGIMRFVKRAAGGGTVLLSLTQEMTLRMRAMLAQIYPNVEFTELCGAESPELEDASMPEPYFMAAMRLLLYSLLDREELERFKDTEAEGDVPKAQDGSGEEDEEFHDFDPADFDDDEADFDDMTPIDDLYLSLRSSNCLRRAGYDYVEQLYELTFEDYMKIRNFGRKCTEEVMEKVARHKRCNRASSYGDNGTDGNELDGFAMLDELIGLGEVKEQVRKIAAFARMKHDLAERGLGSVPMVLNMEFVGNPGTAKTTVARIIARILKQIGLLISDRPVEVCRADLVAEYVGQTAIKVKDVFDRAIGKLLFIDEAYSLADGYRGSFGDEAITTIVQQMENNRDDTIVVFAGYPNEMEEFFSRNPGLRSRVPFRIELNDYSPEEMGEIIALEAKRRSFTVRPEAMAKAVDICRSEDKANGNGRFCRNLVETAILNYAARVYGEDKQDYASDLALAPEDFTYTAKAEPEKKSVIGFAA